jgi:DNA-binding transcriptional LysR family regulator
MEGPVSAFSREFFTFVEVAREGSMRGAAEKLNLSASALSRQMRILEQAFGARLLVRTTQGVQLTEQGQVLLTQAERWLDDESALRSALTQAGGTGVGSLRLGIMECLVPYILPGLEAVGRLSTLKVSVGGTGTLVGQLSRNEIDALLAFSVPRLPELRVHDERSYDLGVVYSARLGPAGEPPFRMEDCLGRPLCLPDTSLSVWPRLDAELYRIHAESYVAMRSNSIALILEYVAAGKGISFLNWLDVAATVADGRVLFANLGSRRLSEKLYLCAAANAPLAPFQIALARKLFSRIPISRLAA